MPKSRKRCGRPRKMGRPTKNLARQRRWEQRNKDRHKQKHLIAQVAEQITKQGLIIMPAPVKPAETKPAAEIAAAGASAPAAVVAPAAPAVLPRKIVESEAEDVLNAVLDVLKAGKEVPGFALVPTKKVALNPRVEKEVMKFEDGLSLVKTKLEPAKVGAEAEASLPA